MNALDRRGVLLCLCILAIISIPSLIFVLSPPPDSFFFWVNDNFLPSADRIPQSPTETSDQLPLLLLISYDGLRYDYIEKHQNVTPTFRWLISNGVYATDGLKNTFITITAPNHYGIVTGLYEESHGIIANSFFNPDLNETFAYFDTRWKTDPKFFRGDPIWNTNDAAGPDRVTGCMMWVGCDVPINGRPPPKHRVSWDQNLDWIARVDALISWYTDPSKPINFGLLYIEEPDETGHNYGPDSPEIGQMLGKLDQLTAYLLWRLYTAELLDKINIIFTADHGMDAIPVLNVVNMDNYVNRSLYTVYGGSPNWNVKPIEGKEEEVYIALAGKVPHLTVYKKADIPVEFHYKNASSVMPLQLIPDLHWWITFNYTSSVKDNDTFPKQIEEEINGRRLKMRVTSKNYTFGEHGFNNSILEMHPYFIGYGPAFKKSYNVTQFMNLDLYLLMCYILHVNPSPNNGSFDRVRSILRDEGLRWSKYGNFSKTFSDGLKKKSSIFDGVAPGGSWNDDFYRVIRLCTNGFNVDLLLMLLILLLYVSYLFYALKSIKPGNRAIGVTRKTEKSDVN